MTFNRKSLCLLILFELACLFFCSTIAVLFFIFDLLGGTILFGIWSLFLAALWVGGYGCSVKKVDFIKNEFGNQYTLKITKSCGCSKQYTNMIENSYLLYQDDIMQLIVLKSSRDIDLDNSNIQNYPINLITIYGNYMDLKSTENEIQLKNDEFLGQKKYENNIYDEIDKYNSLYNKNYSNDIKKTFDIYMKINEYFYTFFYSDKSVYSRTDFIYSNDFGRLFIGGIYKDKYNKTLLFNLNEINKFEMFEEKKSDDDGSYIEGYLRIIYIYEQKEEISISRNKTLYLEKFILLLNGKLNGVITKI